MQTEPESNFIPLQDPEAFEPLNNEQLTAARLVLAGENVFITGPGGTGKSFTLNAVMQALNDSLSFYTSSMVYTASTGIAAVQIGGRTIHSYLGTGICGSVEDAKKKIAQLNRDKKHGTIRWYKRRLKELTTLVVDEVSMLSANYISMIDWWLRYMRDDHETPFGGVQVVFTGDFLQLPPVPDRSGAPTPKLAFQSKSWEWAEIKTCHLRTSMRQDNQTFVDALNEIRVGSLRSRTAALFEQCVNRKLDDPTHLMSTNARVATYNAKRLAELDSQNYVYQAKTQGYGKWPGSAEKRITKSVMADKILNVRIGARVIILKNDSGMRYVNGTRATVSRCPSEDSIEVSLDDGTSLILPAHEWETRDGDGQVEATFKQVPVKLAYALTIHKSQGMTLDPLHVTNENLFAEGQLYVALSRSKRLEGLCLKKRLDPLQVNANEAAVRFYEKGN